MQTKIARWGNSLAVRLPAEVVRDLGLSEGQTVELKPNAPNLEIVPRSRGRQFSNGTPVYSLSELLADMDRLGPDAVPPLLDWGPDRGVEIVDDGFPRDPTSPDPHANDVGAERW